MLSPVAISFLLLIIRQFKISMQKGSLVTVLWRSKSARLNRDYGTVSVWIF